MGVEGESNFVGTLGFGDSLLLSKDVELRLTAICAWWLPVAR